VANFAEVFDSSGELVGRIRSVFELIHAPDRSDDRGSRLGGSGATPRSGLNLDQRPP
jgi:hypothetical protein